MAASDPGLRRRELLTVALDRQQSGQLAEAERLYQSVLSADARDFDALHLLGTLRIQSGDADGGAALIRRALLLRPDWRAECNLAVACAAQGDLAGAVAATGRAVALRPDLPQTARSHATALRAAGMPAEALSWYRRVLTAAPADGAARAAVASLLLELRRYQECVDLGAGPTDGSSLAALLTSRGTAFARLRRYEEAAEAYAAALAAGAASGVRALEFVCRQHACDWSDSEAELLRLRTEIEQGEAIVDPLILLVAYDDPQLQQRAAARVMLSVGAVAPVVRSPRPHGRSRLRLCYLSADIRNHPTSLLLAETLERHDRARFEVALVTWGSDDRSELRRRMMQACDCVIEAADLSDADVASRLGADAIDVAVDLRPHGVDARPGILARRPAAVQFSYLGYPGTSGAAFIDYLVADKIVVPPADVAAFSESIAYLPGCYQPQDSRRPVPSGERERSLWGLPTDAFVFCCFNNSFKITPTVFAVWMRLLRAVPRSVLWLLSDAPETERNLRDSAHRAGVDTRRLVFAPRVGHELHLRRHLAADLSLDTFPCNAHTTASDALWCGVPLVTCAGKSFASRVAASLLHNAGLPELVTASLDDYEAVCRSLAGDPVRVEAIRRHLRAQVLAMQAGGFGGYVDALECAFSYASDRSRSGQTPSTFAVEPADDGFQAVAMVDHAQV